MERLETSNILFILNFPGPRTGLNPGMGLEGLPARRMA